MTALDLKEIASVRRMLSHTRGEGRSSVERRTPLKGDAMRRREWEKEIREEARQRVKNTQAHEMAKILQKRVGAGSPIRSQLGSPYSPTWTDRPTARVEPVRLYHDFDEQPSPPPPPSSPSCDSLDDVAIVRCSRLLSVLPDNNSSSDSLSTRQPSDS
eukprot:TRINITY_DN9037_c0_g1_i2.p1 TRINITY_DN9037_c0_g1~~TRINITY_DN9037_c0_g1_i2.p1  ORF type:complete len:158 (+),score=28.83 TRINITY_DN9037_c0_g1_i2:95-568(+)